MAYEEGRCAVTEISWSWSEKRLVIHPVKGDASLLPEKRQITVEIWGCTQAEARAEKNGVPAACETAYDGEKGVLEVTGVEAGPGEELAFLFDDGLALRTNDRKKGVFAFLSQAEIPYLTKQAVYREVCGCEDTGMLLRQLRAMELEEDLFDCISEYLA